MFLRVLNRKGEFVSGETIKWIIWIGILIAAIMIVRNIVSVAS